MSLIAMGFYWAAEKLTTVELPTSEIAPLLYSNQTHDDLTLTFQEGIKQAQDSVLLIIYTLTDSKIINALKQKSEEGIPITLICDGRANPFVERKVGNRVKLIKRYAEGIMHQKILVVDKAQIWVGSANMTGESLKMHGNLVMGLHSTALGELITQKAMNMPEEGRGMPFASHQFLMGGQTIEMCFLPDEQEAMQKIKKLISSAQKTIRIAMFTWTLLDFAEEVVRAFNRGVKVSVALDRYAGHGAGLQVAAYLKKNGIPLFYNQGAGLLHHKFMEIDGRILVNGSANWTKAALKKNDDCFIILFNLNVNQQEKMNKLWKVIVNEAIIGHSPKDFNLKYRFPTAFQDSTFATNSL